jgi:hypothetical protein
MLIVSLSGKYKTTLIRNKNAFVFILLISACLLCCCGCNKSPAKNYHPEYFDRIFKIIDTTQNENKDVALALLDSAFRAFPNPCIFYLYAQDTIKADIYSYVKHDNIQAVAYSDSMLLLVEKRTDEEEFAGRYARDLYYKAKKTGFKIAC